MSLNYSKKTLKHFRQPKNVGEIKNPDAIAQVGSMVCGDQLTFTLKIKDQKIEDIKFLSFGCASNIATASMMTEMVKGMTLEEAKKFDWNKIVAELGGLPKQKIHCSVLAVEGLRKVISEFESRKTDSSSRNTSMSRNSSIKSTKGNKKVVKKKSTGKKK